MACFGQLQSSGFVKFRFRPFINIRQQNTLLVTMIEVSPARLGKYWAKGEQLPKDMF